MSILVAAVVGWATYYYPDDGHCGKWRADGKRFTKGQCHVAHRTIKLGTRVRVCSLTTKRCTVSVVRDRGPYGAISNAKWVLKRRKSDPGKWRGLLDMTRCVWKRIGGPGRQLVSLKILN